MNRILNPLARLSASLGSFAAIVALFVGAAAPAQAALPASYQHPVMGYFDATGKASDIDRIPWDALTHLNIAFAGINADGQCAWMDPSGNDEPDTSGMMPKLIKKLVAARDAHGKNTKLVLSVGGWTMSYRFYEATKTWQKTDALAASCVALMQNSGLDGLDYDWEYPTKLGKKNCPKGMVCETRDDPAQFTELLRASRKLMGVDSITHPLTAAVYAIPGSKGIPYDIAGMDAQLTYWNIMAYDLAAPNWSPGTDFHAPILAVQQSMQAFHEAGVPKIKLNLGIPYYGYIWKNVGSATVGAKAPNNKQNWSQYSTVDIQNRYANDAGCKLFNDRNGNFYYCSTGKHAGEWAAIDDADVLKTKALFVRNQEFGGVLIWAVQTDTQGALTQTLYTNLNTVVPTLRRK